MNERERQAKIDNLINLFQPATRSEWKWLLIAAAVTLAVIEIIAKIAP